ncbi:MAG TPA: hypothetical protein DD706_22090 [Nitrospiraceae bacterium]|nr:hypothetical protein [Nitrospiraceae bacterium]
MKAQGYAPMPAYQWFHEPTLLTQADPQAVIVNGYWQNSSGVDALGQHRREGYAGKIIFPAGNSVSSEIPQALWLGIDQVPGRPVSFNQVVSAVGVAIGTPVASEDQSCRKNQSHVPLATMA